MHHGYLAISWILASTVQFTTGSGDGLLVSDCGNKRSGVTHRVPNHTLAAPVLFVKTVDSEMECLIACVRTSGCLSFDVEVCTGGQRCYLYNTDKYREPDKLARRAGTDHFFFENSCTSNSCCHGYTCIPRYHNQSFSCESAPNSTKHFGLRVFMISDSKKYWSVDTSKNLDGAEVKLSEANGSQFVIHVQEGHDGVGQVSFEMMENPGYYVTHNDDTSTPLLLKHCQSFEGRKEIFHMKHSRSNNTVLFTLQNPEQNTILQEFYNVYLAFEETNGSLFGWE
ncbi:uncharacterized protein LOC116620224 [Nematostella vectensis]|uniref:uncharacterized protein LOC116620224 n=1 Tax=Nematostella vectensis TaxID=45351 RepID=UPI0020775ED3|nr:uncharacterized protein LOC116620224 [Nematostella vectensis]XP_048582079.1 uncharacterized protein LOC116620224 [Nematostella vectensis]